MKTIGAPRPRSMTCISVAQRLSGLEGVLDSFERLALAAEFQKRFALQIEEIRFADRRLMRQRPAREDIRQRAADEGVVIGDATGAPGEMHAEVERGADGLAADRNRGPRHRTLIALAHPLERVLLRVRDQPLAIHGDAVRFVEESELTRVLGAR